MGRQVEAVGRLARRLRGLAPPRQRVQARRARWAARPTQLHSGWLCLSRTRTKGTMVRTPLLVAAAVAVIAAGAPNSSTARACPHNYTMHELIRYGRRVMPVPTKGQLNALARMAHCMWAPRLRAVARSWQRRHMIRLGEHRWASSTAYSACDSGTVTAAGTGTFFGEVAQNDLPLGTRIWMDSPVHGKRLFVVLDRIGSGSELDFFMPCGWVDAWGRREVGYRVVR